VEQLADLGLLELGGSQPYPGSKEQQDLIDSLSWVSRIRIDAKERPAIAAAIDDAKAYADLINSRCGEDEPMFSVVTVTNRTRDGAESRVSRLAENGDLLKNAPSTKRGYFKVASILE
jgi:aspartyl-tRNA synthetase